MSGRLPYRKQHDPIESRAGHGHRSPERVEDVQEALRRTTGAVSIGGGRFSMGGQTAGPGSLHFDMRSLTKMVSFAPVERVIRVQAGVRWCDVQRFVDPHGLSVKTMQTYANFTVGGSLSVNCHGRYVGLGPLDPVGQDHPGGIA